MEVFSAEGKGMGLKLLEPVSKGQFIAEYVGEVCVRLLQWVSAVSYMTPALPLALLCQLHALNPSITTSYPLYRGQTLLIMSATPLFQ